MILKTWLNLAEVGINIKYAIGISFVISILILADNVQITKKNPTLTISSTLVETSINEINRSLGIGLKYSITTGEETVVRVESNSSAEG